MILPWSHDDPARAFDHVVRLVWGFWQRMETCPNGVPYYLQHQVWKPEHDPRGLGGDQISMALNSWKLLHGYLGDPAVVANMRLLADYWLARGMDVHSGRYEATWWRGRVSCSRTRRGPSGPSSWTSTRSPASPDTSRRRPRSRRPSRATSHAATPTTRRGPSGSTR